MQVEISMDDDEVVPTIGPGALTREGAHRKILEILERVADARPATCEFDAGVLGVWREGAIDDMVTAPPFVWAIYEYPASGDPQRAAVAWLHNFAPWMESTDIDVQMARQPDGAAPEEAPGEACAENG